MLDTMFVQWRVSSTGQCTLMKGSSAMLSRRRLLTSASGIAVAGVAGARTAGAESSSSSTVKMWRLNPDWGTPITTDSGSSTKTRCKGKACHLAAPNRLFLTEADALAGRLHPCCLAQPVPVWVNIDLNALMPFYQARHGGVDLRCPDLPQNLQQALVLATTLEPTGSTRSSNLPGQQLAFTGTNQDKLVVAAGLAVGTGWWMQRRSRQEMSDSVNPEDS